MSKILLIGSELQNSHQNFNFLEIEGFDLITAENSFDGLCKAQSELPDLIIYDIVLPQLDAYRIIRKLREHPTTAIIPLICVMNTSNIAEIRKAMEAGADDCITKFSTKEELLKAIKIRLDRQAYLLEWYGIQAKKMNLTVKNNPRCINTISFRKREYDLSRCNK